MTETVAVLEWSAWEGFLLRNVLGDCAVRIKTDPFSAFPPAQFEHLCQSVSIVCFQIDLSVRRQLPLPIRDLTRRFAQRGVYVVNGLVQDIRKSVLHAHLKTIGLPSLRAPSAGPPDEKLFVKTNLNYGGEKEKALPPDLLDATRLKDFIAPSIGPYSYTVVERKALPTSMWQDPTLVVETFITNPENSFFRVYFSGKQVIIVKAFALGIVKKMSADPRDTNFVSELDYLKDGSDGLPLSPTLKRAVATFVERTPVEFGCLDIVHDGRDNHYVIDLNLTPSAASDEPHTDLHKFLRLGITHPLQRKPAVPLNTPLV